MTTSKGSPSKSHQPPWVRLVVTYLFIFGLTESAQHLSATVVRPQANFSLITSFFELLASVNVLEAAWPSQFVFNFLAGVVALVMAILCRRREGLPVSAVIALGLVFGLWYTSQGLTGLDMLTSYSRLLGWSLASITSAVFRLIWLILVIVIIRRADRRSRPAFLILNISLLAHSVWTFPRVIVNAFTGPTRYLDVLALIENPSPSSSNFPMYMYNPHPAWVDCCNALKLGLDYLYEDATLIGSIVVVIVAARTKRLPRIIGAFLVAMGLWWLLGLTYELIMRLVEYSSGGWGYFLYWIWHSLQSILLGAFLWSILGDLHRKEGLSYPACGRCDYDLTGNTSGICPECGATIPANN